MTGSKRPPVLLLLARPFVFFVANFFFSGRGHRAVPHIYVRRPHRRRRLVARPLACLRGSDRLFNLCLFNPCYTVFHATPCSCVTPRAREPVRDARVCVQVRGGVLSCCLPGVVALVCAGINTPPCGVPLWRAVPQASTDDEAYWASYTQKKEKPSRK